MKFLISVNFFAYFTVICITLRIGAHCARRLPANRANDAFAFCVFTHAVYMLFMTIAGAVILVSMHSGSLAGASYSSAYLVFFVSFMCLGFALRYGSNHLYKKRFGDPLGMMPDKNKEAESYAPNWKEHTPLIDILENRFLRVLAASLAAFMTFASGRVLIFLFFQFLMPVRDRVYSVSDLLTPQNATFLIMFIMGIYRIIGENILPSLKRKPEKANAICGFYLFFLLCNIFFMCFMLVFSPIALTRYLSLDSFILSFILILLLFLLLSCFGFYIMCKIANWLYKKIFDDPAGMASKYKMSL
jgi:hypothetical protein